MKRIVAVLLLFSLLLCTGCSKKTSDCEGFVHNANGYMFEPLPYDISQEEAGQAFEQGIAEEREMPEHNEVFDTVCYIEDVELFGIEGYIDMQFADDKLRALTFNTHSHYGDVDAAFTRMCDSAESAFGAPTDQNEESAGTIARESLRWLDEETGTALIIAKDTGSNGTQLDIAVTDFPSDTAG